MLKLNTHAVHREERYIKPAKKNMYPELFVFTLSLTSWDTRVAIDNVPTQRQKREKSCANNSFGKNKSDIPKNIDLNISACSLSDAKPNTL